MNLYWISWEQPTEDYRPLTFPPNEGVLGWWCTGEGDGYWTICAYVQAEDQASAEEVIRKDWPEAVSWRFCDKQDHVTYTDRFPVDGGWAQQRLANWALGGPSQVLTSTD